MPLARISVRMEIVGSPAPRKAALIRNSRMTVTLPPSITRVKRLPIAITSCDAPIAASRRGAASAPDHADDDGQPDAERDRLDGGPRRAVRILLADAARDDRGGAHRQAHRERIDDDQHRFGQHDRGDRVGAQLRHPEDVGDREHRLHHHLEHHRDGEQQDRPPQRQRREVVARAAQRFADERARSRRGCGAAISGRCGGGGGVGAGSSAGPLYLTTNDRPPGRQARRKSFRSPDPSP